MLCPKCDSEKKTEVIDKRNDGPEDSIRRRRRCKECGERWTTYEIKEEYVTFE